jgi:hypothetical protein
VAIALGAREFRAVHFTCSVQHALAQSDVLVPNNSLVSCCFVSLCLLHQPPLGCGARLAMWLAGWLADWHSAPNFCESNLIHVFDKTQKL